MEIWGDAQNSCSLSLSERADPLSISKHISPAGKGHTMQVRSDGVQQSQQSIGTWNILHAIAMSQQ